MTITFDEAVNGCKKIIRLTIDEECPQCGGSGAYSRSDIKTCDKCHGSGYVFVEQRTIFGIARSQSVCPRCGGRGQEITKKCDRCGGKGKIRTTKDIEIKIPAGIDDGMTLRVEGKGEAGTMVLQQETYILLSRLRSTLSSLEITQILVLQFLLHSLRQLLVMK